MNNHVATWTRIGFGGRDAMIFTISWERLGEQLVFEKAWLIDFGLEADDDSIFRAQHENSKLCQYYSNRISIVRGKSKIFEENCNLNAAASVS